MQRAAAASDRRVERDGRSRALVDGVRAARMEAAAGRERTRTRDLPPDHRQSLAGLRHLRHRLQQPLRVRVVRLREDVVDGRLLDDLARVHDCDAVTQVGDDAEVVGHEQDRGAELGLQRAHEVEDLGLDRHVERGRGLVGDEQLRIARQRHGDHRPLAHPARERVG